MRMMITFLVASLAILHVAPVQAQATPVLVRAGEHRDYTRLLLQLPEESHWHLRKGTISARLEIEGPLLEFDLTEAFARIPRTRLRDLRTSENGLDLYIACDCEIQAREDIPQFLIIDIIGTASYATFAPLTAPRPPKHPRYAITARPGTAIDPRYVGTRLARAMRGATPTTALPHALTLSGVIGTAPPLPKQEIFDAASVDTPQIAAALGRVLASSVSSGRLEAATEFTDPFEQVQDDEGDPQISDMGAGAHISVAKQDRNQEMPPRSQCPEASLLDPARWSAQTEAGMLSRDLEKLFDDFGQPDPEHIQDYARRLIQHGFGAETRMVLSLLTEPDEAADILTAISYLVDKSELPSTFDLAPWAACGSMGSLWAFLADRDTTLPADFSTDDLVQALRSLPASLRLHLGPEAVQRLAALEHWEEAQVILTSLERVAPANTDQLNLAKAALDLPRASSDMAPMLEATLSPNTSDDDLIFLLSRRAAEGQPLEINLLELARTRLFALRGTPRGREIASLLIHALGHDGDFEQAFGLLEGREAALPIDAVEPLRFELLQGLVTQADDTDFISLTFAQRPWDLRNIPATLAEKLTMRLRSLGFDMQADMLEMSAKNAVEHQAGDRNTVRDALAQRPITIGPTDTEDAQETTSGETAPLRSPDAASGSVPAERDAEEDVILRARAAQEQARREAVSRANGATAPERSAATQSTAATGFPSVAEPDQPAAVTELDTINDEQSEVATAPDAAILSHSRDALGQSAELRARLQTLLDEGIQH